MKKILVIESNPIYQAELCRLLAFERYQVLRAVRGMDGITLAFQQHPDLVLCDILMPDLTGYEILEKLQTHPSTAKIPFILLGGKTDMRSHAYAIKVGAAAYLSKLVPPHELLRVVATKLKPSSKST